MTRVSPPDEDRELPGPQASSKVTLAPASRRCRAVHPPKAPAPITAMCGLARIQLRIVSEGFRLRVCNSAGHGEFLDSSRALALNLTLTAPHPVPRIQTGSEVRSKT